MGRIIVGLLLGAIAAALIGRPDDPSMLAWLIVFIVYMVVSKVREKRKSDNGLFDFAIAPLCSSCIRYGTDFTSYCNDASRSSYGCKYFK